MRSDAQHPKRPVGVSPESGSGRLVVVCDDGSVWKWHLDGGWWEEMPPIPGTGRSASETGTTPPGA